MGVHSAGRLTDLDKGQRDLGVPLLGTFQDCGTMKSKVSLCQDASKDSGSILRVVLRLFSVSRILL